MTKTENKNLAAVVSVIAITAAISASISAANAQQAQDFNVACTRGDEVRKVTVVSPGTVGASCDVQYVRAVGGAVSTPYHANNTPDFCYAKANELVGTLISAGYSCGPVKPTVSQAPVQQTPIQQTPTTPVTSVTTPIAEPEIGPEERLAIADESEAQAVINPLTVQTAEPVQPAVAPEAAPVIEAAPQALAPAQPAQLTPTNEPQALAPVEEAVTAIAAEPIAEPTVNAVPSGVPAIEEELLSAPVPASPQDNFGESLSTAPVIEESDIAAIEETALVEIPKVRDSVATSGPEVLTTQAVVEPTRASVNKKAYSKIVGVAPDAEKVANVSLPSEQPAVVTGPAVAEAPVAAPAQKIEKKKPASKTALRDSKKTIVATLDAQAAAWNEGNLKAFMEIYWKSDELKFVSGGKILTGWNSAMKRYRDLYADESGLGLLSFDKTDVEMIRNDVAIVTGNFAIEKNGEASSGTFSLVMKRLPQGWRIVHDHTSPTLASAQ